MDVREIAAKIIAGEWEGEDSQGWIEPLAAHVLRSPEPLGECEWCKAGWPLGGPLNTDHFPVGIPGKDPIMDCVSCTAPTTDQVIYDLRAQLAAAQQREKEAANAIREIARWWRDCQDAEDPDDMTLRSSLGSAWPEAVAALDCLTAEPGGRP